MTKQELFELYVAQVKEVMPQLEGHDFFPTDNLRDLGANSIDRVEILMMTLESVGTANLHLIDFAGVNNIGEIIDILHSRL